MKLNIKAFALTCGIIWAIGLFALTWWIIAFDGATGEITLIGKLYRGYTITPLGSIIGLIWGGLCLAVQPPGRWSRNKNITDTNNANQRHYTFRRKA